MNGGLPPFMSMFSEGMKPRQPQQQAGAALNPPFRQDDANHPILMTAGSANTNRAPHGQHLSGVSGVPLLSPSLGFSMGSGSLVNNTPPPMELAMHRVPPNTQEEMSGIGKMAESQNNTVMTPHHPMELLKAQRKMALSSQMETNMVQMKMAQGIPCQTQRMGAPLAPIPFGPLVPTPTARDLLSLDYLRHQEEQQQKQNEQQKQQQQQQQQLATSLQQVRLNMSLQQQNEQFARQLQQFAQRHSATSQAISQQGFAVLAAAASSQQGFAALAAAAAAAAAASSLSLNREEHAFGKYSKEQMSFAALSAAAAAAAAATSSPLQNREEHSFGTKSSNETMASQALPGQGFAALPASFLSQNRVEQSLEESSKDTAAFILPHEASDSIASSPTKDQVLSLAQKTTPRAASTSPICSKKKMTKNQLPAVTTPFMRMAAAAGPLGSQGENTGRWTAQEHKLFLKGLGKFGYDAKKIQSVVKSRTIVQIRTHAQKYFRNLAKKTGAIHNPGVAAAASCNQSHVNGESTFEKPMRQRHVGVGTVGNMDAGGSINTSLGNVILADETILNSEDAFRPIATKTAKKNQAASINDAESQGKVESVASTPSTTDIHTTQETSPDAKMVSGQEKTKDTKSSKNIGGNEMPSNGAGANGILARDTKEKLPDDPLHHRNLIKDTLSNNGTTRVAEEKSPRKPHHHHHHHRHLNEETLKMLKCHLQADRGQHLDEDAVAARTVRMERVKRSIVKHDPCEISDKEDNDASARQQAHQNAEDYVLALDFYKKVVADTRKENSGTRLDKKTLDWVRRAMGLHRHSDSRESTSSNEAEQSIESDDEAELQGSEPRRLTRGAARNTRVKKREQRAALDNMGLDALLSAAAHLEEEFGPFTDSKSRKKRKRQKSGTHTANLSSEYPGKRHCSISGTRTVTAPDEKCDIIQQSTVEPTVGQGDTPADTAKKNPVSLSSIKPNVSLVPPRARIFSKRSGNVKLHGLATLAQRFAQIVATSGSHEIDLQDVVDQLGIRKRRIYDVVNILDGAGVMASTRHRNKYLWIPQVDFSHDLKQLAEENRQLEYEEICLDAWIKLQTSTIEAMRRKYSGNKNDYNGDGKNSLEEAIVDEADHESEEQFRPSVDQRKEGQSNSSDLDGEARVRRSPRKRTTRKIDQGDDSKSNHASSSSVKAKDGGTARGKVRDDPALDDETRARKRPRIEATEIAKINDVNSSPVKSNRSLDMSEPLFSRGGGSKLHGLATLAQRFRMMMKATGKHVVDLSDAVEYLGIPRRRIHDVVCILEGAGLMERITPRTEKTLASKYRWIHTLDFSRDLEELEEEERQLDDWIELTSRHVDENDRVETHVESQLLAPFLEEGSTTMAITTARKAILHLPHELEKKPENGHCTFMLMCSFKTPRRFMLPNAFIVEKDGDNVIMHHLPLMPP